jgi:hypothetical protein
MILALIPLKSELAAIIKDGINWFWSSARSNELVEIQNQLHEVAGTRRC